jgi:hypothetical protein
MTARVPRWILPLLATVVLAGVPGVPQEAAPQQPKRPAILAPLWGAYAGLQALDVHSTRRAIGSGSGREANPLLGAAAQSSASLIAIKAASTAGVIYGTGKLWKKNRTLAVLTMVAINGATAAIVARNYRTGLGARRP